MSGTLVRQQTGYMKFLTEGERQGIGVPVVKTTNARSGSTLLWVGLTAKDVRSMLECDYVSTGEIAEKLQKLVDDKKITLLREYHVTGSATITVSMSATVEAASEDEARQLFEDEAMDGPEDMDDYTYEDTTDVDVDDVDAT